MSAASHATLNSRKPSVLVVDDEVDICHNLSDILSAFGYEVDVAFDGESALNLARRRTYDVALLDLKMPGMDGLTLYRELKTISAGTVAMIVTAYASSDTAQKALGAGAWQIVPKPVEMQQLLDDVGRAVGQPTVLVVDDDHDLCENLWQILRAKGFRVSVAHDARDAGRLTQERDHHVVLLDLKLPGTDSVGLFRLIRQSNAEARTILITGHRSEMEDVIGRVLDEGAEAVCYKPFDVPELLDMVRRLSERRGDPA